MAPIRADELPHLEPFLMHSRVFLVTFRVGIKSETIPMVSAEESFTRSQPGRYQPAGHVIVGCGLFQRALCGTQSANQLPLFSTIGQPSGPKEQTGRVCDCHDHTVWLDNSPSHNSVAILPSLSC